MEFLESMVFMAVVLALLAAVLVPPMVRHRKVTAVRNHNVARMKFVYKIEMSQEALLDTLSDSTNNLAFRINRENATMRICDASSTILYYYDIEKIADETVVLRLEQRSYVTMRSQISYKLNPFFVDFLDAELLPFEEYGFDHLRSE